MLNRAFFRRALIFICLTSLLNLLLASLPGLVLAGQSRANSREGLPSRRAGGGSRGGCTVSSPQLTALIPENSAPKTVAESPSLLFYLPKTNEPKKIEFVLRDRSDRLVYEHTFTTKGESGIVSLNLPKRIKSNSLKIDSDYHWYLSLICDPQNRSRDIVVEGSIRRVKLQNALAQKLKRATMQERVSIYQQAGLWYDALATLAELMEHRTNERGVTAQWRELLKSVGLESLTYEPLIGFNVSKLARDPKIETLEEFIEN